MDGIIYIINVQHVIMVASENGALYFGLLEPMRYNASLYDPLSLHDASTYVPSHFTI